MKFFIKNKKGFTHTPKSLVGGFTIIFTVLITSVLLAIALGISSITQKSIMLSSVAREGSKAFFAADSGMECGFYYDIQLGAFGGEPNGVSGVSCVGEAPEIIQRTSSPDSHAQYVYEIIKDLPEESCMKILVYKNWISNSGTSYTRIESRGYNVACSDTSTSHFAVERALRAIYANSSNENTNQSLTGGEENQPGQFVVQPTIVQQQVTTTQQNMIMSPASQTSLQKPIPFSGTLINTENP